MSHHFSIREAKLNPPRVAAPLIARPQLTRILQEGVRHALVVLTAEAGYGKTSLRLASLPELPGQVAWLSLDETDTDPNLFAAALVLALRRVAEGIGEAALKVLTAGPSDAVLRASIVRALEELPGEVVLVVDDFHVLDRTPEGLGLVDHVLSRLPPHVHLVIASRTQPALRSLSSLAVRGEARVLTRMDLAFTAYEVTAFLRHSYGLSVDEAQARHLARRTEGWPAALQLAALVNRGRGPLGLEGTPREVFDYLAATVLEGLPTEIKQFLLYTSILWELTPALCATLTGVVDAEATLEALERRNLFLYRLDEGRARYRYHQLFAEFLQHWLAREEPRLVAELHVRAGRTLEDEGLGDQAVRHYLAAGAFADAVRVMVPYRAGRLTAQRAYTFRDLVRRLPAQVAEEHPWLLRTAASSCRFVGDYAQALAWSRQAATASEGKDVNLWAHSMHGVMVMLASLGRLREAIATGEDALSRLPGGVDLKMRADLHLVVGTCYRLAGQLAEAHRQVDEGLRLGRRSGDLDGVAQGLINRGWLALTCFAPSAAREHFDELARWSEDQHSPAYQATAHAGLAAVSIALGDVAAAHEALDRASLLHAQVGERSLELQLGWTRSDLALLRGDLDEAGRGYHQVLAQCREGESARPRIFATLGLSRVAAPVATAPRLSDTRRRPWRSVAAATLEASFPWPGWKQHSHCARRAGRRRPCHW